MIHHPSQLWLRAAVQSLVQYSIFDAHTSFSTNHSQPEQPKIAPKDSAAVGGSRKRKDPGDYSTNPNTVKRRKRLATIALEPIRHQVEKAKAADQRVVTYAEGMLLKSATYMQASDLDKATMVMESKARVLLKRYASSIPLSQYQYLC